MKKIGIIALPLLVLGGCQTGPARLQPSTTSSAIKTENVKKDCAFNSINSKSYRLADSYRQNVSPTFYYDPRKDAVLQKDASRFRSLESKKFKISETGISTLEDIKLSQISTPETRYTSVELDQTLYKKDRAHSTILMTEDCSTYYLNGSADIKSIKESIVNVDGSKIDDKDVMNLLGEKVLQPLNMVASIEYDRFEKKLEVKTPSHEKMLIRGAVNTKKNSITYIQLYVELIFIEKWGEISYAVDTDAQHHEVTPITRDSDCSTLASIVGCVLTETVGVTLSHDFLKKHQDGFELKVAGQQDRLVTVPGSMVKGFLAGLDKAIKKSKSGEFSGA